MQSFFVFAFIALSCVLLLIIIDSCLSSNLSLTFISPQWRQKIIHAKCEWNQLRTPDFHQLDGPQTWQPTRKVCPHSVNMQKGVLTKLVIHGTPAYLHTQWLYIIPPILLKHCAKQSNNTTGAFLVFERGRKPAGSWIRHPKKVTFPPQSLIHEPMRQQSHREKRIGMDRGRNRTGDVKEEN